MGSRRKSKKGMKTGRKIKRGRGNVKKGGAKSPNNNNECVVRNEDLKCVTTSLFVLKGLEALKIFSVDTLEKIVFTIKNMPKKNIQNFLTNNSQEDISKLCKSNVENLEQRLKQLSNKDLEKKVAEFEGLSNENKSSNQVLQLNDKPLNFMEPGKGLQIAGAGPGVPPDQARRVLTERDANDPEWPDDELRQRMRDELCGVMNQGDGQTVAFEYVMQIYGIMLGGVAGVYSGYMIQGPQLATLLSVGAATALTARTLGFI